MCCTSRRVPWKALFAVTALRTSQMGRRPRSAASVADGQWHKVLCERSGPTLSVYVDNVVRGTVTIPANLNISNPLPLRVGGPNFNTKTDMYHGRLDDVYAELG